MAKNNREPKFPRFYFYYKIKGKERFVSTWTAKRRRLSFIFGQKLKHRKIRVASLDDIEYFWFEIQYSHNTDYVNCSRKYTLDEVDQAYRDYRVFTDTKEMNDMLKYLA